MNECRLGLRCFPKLGRHPGGRRDPVLGGIVRHGRCRTVTDGRSRLVRLAGSEPWAPAFAGVTAGGVGQRRTHQRPRLRRRKGRPICRLAAPPSPATKGSQGEEADCRPPCRANIPHCPSATTGPFCGCDLIRDATEPISPSSLHDGAAQTFSGRGAIPHRR